jgi:hypothetical protein
MNDYVCIKCGHEVLSDSVPQPIKWDDGHVCHFIREPELPEPRKPTEEEITSILEYLGHVDKLERVEHRNIIKRAYIAVFDNYMPDTPGWTGKAIAILWPGDVSLYEVLTVDNDGHFVHEVQDLGMRRD